MPILRSSPLSPYGRKVKTAAMLTGYYDALSIVTTDTTDPNDPVRVDNPLGKIPVLILDNGQSLYDSRVIVEFLDVEAGGGHLVPASGIERWRVLTGQALADGITDAAILVLYESRFRPVEKHEQKWLDHQNGKIDRGLARLAAEPPHLEGMLRIDAVATACLLEWLDFRFPGRWRPHHPSLVTFIEAFNARLPAFASTRPA